jgi:hypothetical protein
MKKLLLILCIFCSTNLLFGQVNVDIPKGMNRIILSTEHSENENIKQLIKVLKELDIQIQKIDTFSFQVKTFPKNMGSYTYTLFFNVFDKRIVVSSTYNSNIGFQLNNLVYNDIDSDVVTTKRRNSIENKIFFKMREILIWIGQEKNIEYEYIK